MELVPLNTTPSNGFSRQALTLNYSHLKWKDLREDKGEKDQENNQPTSQSR